VAAMLGLSPVTVRWHLMAARRKLRRLLAPLAPHGEPAGADDVGEARGQTAATRRSADVDPAKRRQAAE